MVSFFGISSSKGAVKSVVINLIPRAFVKIKL